MHFLKERRVEEGKKSEERKEEWKKERRKERRKEKRVKELQVSVKHRCKPV